ncbi:MAG: hypothetical protein K6T59_14230 [Bryobacteraceae bacterium]|nr:hypothetical protein [Bryobacteraceae bacterium]
MSRLCPAPFWRLARAITWLPAQPGQPVLLLAVTSAYAAAPAQATALWAAGYGVRLVDVTGLDPIAGAERLVTATRELFTNHAIEPERVVLFAIGPASPAARAQTNPETGPESAGPGRQSSGGSLPDFSGLPPCSYRLAYKAVFQFSGQ